MSSSEGRAASACAASGWAAAAGPAAPGGAGVLTSDVLTPAAAFLGISVSTLASDLNGGKTLAQEATAKSKKADDLISAIVAAQKTNLDNEKAAGWITADQETAILARYTDAVTDLVNSRPAGPAGRRGPAACCRRRPRSSGCRSPISRPP